MIEPLVDNWYAWSHLIPPATAARNLSGRHLTIMSSYIDNPEVHAAAVRNPSLRGGPFMDYRKNEADRIAELKRETLRRRSALVELDSSLAQIDDLLTTEATGYSLEPLYARLPAALRGYVELTYDLRNQPSFRLIEPLLYRSRFYNTDGQGVALSLAKGDDRPFVLSTPRLPQSDAIHMSLAFEDDTIDVLAKSTYEPMTLPQIDALLDRCPTQQALFHNFFTPEPPPPYQAYTGEGVRWRYFGHACVLIETRDTTILVDPVISYEYKAGIPRYTYADLPPSIDFALITHNHQDHILFETLLRIRHRVRTLVVPRNGRGSLQDPSLRLILEQCGFRNTIELSDMQELKTATGSITALPFLGEHGDLDIQTKSAYLVRAGRHSLLFAADSANVDPELYTHVHRWIGDVDALFLGMECDGAPTSWLYGPLFSHGIPRGMDQTRRLAGSNCERGIRIVDDLACKEVYVYAMGQEPWLNYIMAIKYTEESNPIVQSNMLLRMCLERGVVAERLFGEREILLP